MLQIIFPIYIQLRRSIKPLCHIIICKHAAEIITIYLRFGQKYLSNFAQQFKQQINKSINGFHTLLLASEVGQSLKSGHKCVP